MSSVFVETKQLLTKMETTSEVCLPPGSPAVTAQPPARLQRPDSLPPPPYSRVNPLPILEPPGAEAAAAPAPASAIPRLGLRPRPVVCPSCRHRVITSVHYVSSTNTHVIAGFVCGVTLWCLMCCVAAIPYYLNYCKIAEHYCPHCNSYIGGYSKL